MKFTRKSSISNCKHKQIADEYRHLAGIADSEVLTEDTLVPWALNRVTMNNRMNLKDVKKCILESTELSEDVATAEPTIDAAVKQDAQKADAVPVETDNIDIKQGVIEKTLDTLLARNISKRRRGNNQSLNVIFVGGAGTGKSSRIQAWAKRNNINLLTKALSSMDFSEVGGTLTPPKEAGDTAHRTSTDDFDGLDRPRSVLFLDEYNRASQSVRNTALQLVADHWIPGNGGKDSDGKRYFPELLFSIIAINPDDYSRYNTQQLDDAELSRAKRVDLVDEPEITLNYLIRDYTEAIKDAAEDEDAEEVKMYEGRLKIAKALLESPDFYFDSPEDTMKSKESGNGLLLCSRTLTQTLDECDGTKKDFIDVFPTRCNNQKLPMIKSILNNYKDNDDKATAALRKDVFAKTKTNLDKINDALADLE